MGPVFVSRLHADELRPATNLFERHKKSTKQLSISWTVALMPIQLRSCSFQSFQVRFCEPWLRGRPYPLVANRLCTAFRAQTSTGFPRHVRMVHPAVAWFESTTGTLLCRHSGTEDLAALDSAPRTMLRDSLHSLAGTSAQRVVVRVTCTKPLTPHGYRHHHNVFCYP
jgi:hypothetical protein